MNLHADYLGRLLARRCSEAAGTMPRLDGMTFAQYRAAQGERRPYISAHALNRIRAALRELEGRPELGRVIALSNPTSDDFYSRLSEYNRQRLTNVTTVPADDVFYSRITRASEP